jgi:hypothetical protein
VAWLGPAADESEKAMKFMKTIGKIFFKKYQPVQGASDDPEFLGDGIARSIYQLFGRDYWQRLWVLQEIAVGQVAITCGQDWATWEYFMAAVLRLSGHAWHKFISLVRDDIDSGRLTFRDSLLGGARLMLR